MKPNDQKLLFPVVMFGSMGIVIVFFVLMVVAVFVSTSQGAITRVQSKVNSTGAGTASTVTVTLTSNATVGNTLMVCSVQSTGVLSQVKYGSNSWVPSTLTGAGNVNVGFGFVPVVEVSNTIVVTTTAAARIAVIVVEYSGRLIACDWPPLQATGTSTTNATGTTGTTISANELLLGVMARAGTFASEQTGWLTSPTNSFVSVVQTSSSSNNAADRALAVLERFVTSTGTYSTAGTQASSAWANVIATFADNPTPTPTATATATPTATATATATPTNTPTPTVTPTPCGGISRARADNPQ